MLEAEAIHRSLQAQCKGSKVLQGAVALWRQLQRGGVGGSELRAVVADAVAH